MTKGRAWIAILIIVQCQKSLEETLTSDFPRLKQAPLVNSSQCHSASYREKHIHKYTKTNTKSAWQKKKKHTFTNTASVTIKFAFGLIMIMSWWVFRLLMRRQDAVMMKKNSLRWHKEEALRGTWSSYLV